MLCHAEVLGFFDAFTCLWHYRLVGALETAQWTMPSSTEHGHHEDTAVVDGPGVAVQPATIAKVRYLEPFSPWPTFSAGKMADFAACDRRDDESSAITACEGTIEDLRVGITICD